MPGVSVNDRVRFFEHIEPLLRKVPANFSFDEQAKFLKERVTCHRQTSKLKWYHLGHVKVWMRENTNRDSSGRVTGIHPYDKPTGNTAEVELPSFNDVLKWLKENLASSSRKIWVPKAESIPDYLWDQISCKDQEYLEAASKLVCSLYTNNRWKDGNKGEDVDFRCFILEEAGVNLRKDGKASDRNAVVRYRGNDEDSAGYLLPVAIYWRLGVKDAKLEPYPLKEEFLEMFKRFMEQPEQVRTKKVINAKVAYDNERQSEIQEFTAKRKEAYIAAKGGRHAEYRDWCSTEGCSHLGCDVRDGRIIEGDHKTSKLDGGEKSGKPGEMSNPEFRREKHLLQRLCCNHHGLKTKDDDDERRDTDWVKTRRREIHCELIDFVKEAYFKKCCSCGLVATADTTRAFDLHHPFDTRGCLSPYGTLLVKKKLDAISTLCSDIYSFREFKDKIFPELAIVVLLCKNCHVLQTNFLDEQSTIPDPFPKNKISKRVYYTATSDAYMATILEGPDCSDYDTADDDLPLSSLGRRVSNVEEPSNTEATVTVAVPPPEKRRRISCDDESSDDEE